MAIIPINVIMTSQEANSGPLYDVYYSIDGINYILSLTDANLPSVGSSVVVNVDEDYCRIRLVDASTSCEGTTNTINVGGCISTTTTTTTTTSTTSTSTTTTTTTAPPDCRINTTINVTETGWIRWTLCDGTVQDTFLTSLGTYTITQCIQYDSIRAAIPLAELADWDNVVWGTSCTTETTTTTTTTTTAGPIQVTGVFGYMQPCIGGTIDDYMGASVNLSAPVSVDTEVVVDVKYVFPGNSCGFGESTQAIYLTIPSGSTTDNFDACLNGIYFSGGATICSACIASCDNPSVDLSTFSC